ncbi:hypothetical protein [Enterococcus alishanensis]
MRDWVVQVLGVDGGVRFESLTHGTERQAKLLLATFEHRAGYPFNH